MAVTVKQTIEAEYTEADLKRLIQADLAKKQINVDLGDIKLVIWGGTLNEDWKSYSGGGGAPSTPEVDPVRFNGFKVHKVVDVPQTATR